MCMAKPKRPSELVLWQTVAAKFAYMLVAHEHPDMTDEVEKEATAAALLAACLDREMQALAR